MTGSVMLGSKAQLLGGICATHFNAVWFGTATSLQKGSQESPGLDEEGKEIK